MIFNITNVNIKLENDMNIVNEVKISAYSVAGLSNILYFTVYLLLLLIQIRHNNTI